MVEQYKGKCQGGPYDGEFYDWHSNVWMPKLQGKGGIGRYVFVSSQFSPLDDHWLWIDNDILYRMVNNNEAINVQKGHVPDGSQTAEFDRLNRRIEDLLTSNNKLLERARTAESALSMAKDGNNQTEDHIGILEADVKRLREQLESAEKASRANLEARCRQVEHMSGQIGDLKKQIAAAKPLIANAVFMAEAMANGLNDVRNRVLK